MICPQCGGADTRASRKTYPMDLLHRILGKEPFRCRTCHRRFYSSESAGAPSSLPSPSPRKKQAKGMHSRSRRRRKLQLIALAIFALAFIVFWLFLRYVTQEKSPAQDSGALSTHLMTIES